MRAVLRYFLFVYIHPRMDGNGRLVRFIFNALLVAGGREWTMVPAEQQTPCMAALERAGAYGETQLLAKFFVDLIRGQSVRPLPRPAG